MLASNTKVVVDEHDDIRFVEKGTNKCVHGKDLSERCARCEKDAEKLGEEQTC